MSMALRTTEWWFTRRTAPISNMIKRMKTYFGLESLDCTLDGAVITLGNFDGVHLGHKALISRVIEQSKARGVKSAVVTFHPHPLRIIKTDRVLESLTKLQDKVRLIEKEGVDVFLCINFTPRFAALDPEQFVKNILVARINPSKIIVGKNYRFGQFRSGNVDTLKDIAGKMGVEVEVVDFYRLDDEIVSSTRIRNLIKQGDVRSAARLLDRPYSISGLVISGERRGTKYGVPTANIRPEDILVPSFGVYATMVRIFDRPFRAASYVGTRPTFDGSGILVESHIFDFSLDIYHNYLTVEFMDFLRGERSFASREELIAQIKDDLSRCRQLLADYEV